ncbi:MAG: hypothetical protein Ct9H300mP12_07340 [Acidimicrobiales bacterium]|nr:MAG: hypothetical protein Ct9H300mP12_07340 [Acidimicrobiales bacterium]
MDKIWEERGDASFGIDLPEPPRTYIPGHIWGCIFDDEIGLKNRDVIGMDQICFEVDFPTPNDLPPYPGRGDEDLYRNGASTTARSTN